MSVPAATLLSGDTAPAILQPEPLRIIGGERNLQGLPQALRPSNKQIFAPRGACIHPLDESVWVSDTGHHRLLGWSGKNPNTEPAQWLFGQIDFESEGRNAGSDHSALGLNVPTAVMPFMDGLVLADAWNHRVLIWHALPKGQNQPPDLVLGQNDMFESLPNRGQDSPQATSLYWPFGVLVEGDRLYVADTGNRRVLIWDALPTRSGQPADRILGQRDFRHRDENAGDVVNARSMRWPHALCLWQGKLCVADAGNNRIMIWPDAMPDSYSDCEWILGQSNAESAAHMQGRMSTSAAALNMPYGLSSARGWLIAADTASSRLLAWHESELETGAAASHLWGQADFFSQGDNRWGEVDATGLSWPYGVTTHDNLLVTADTGNSRVLIHQLAL